MVIVGVGLLKVMITYFSIWEKWFFQSYLKNLDFFWLSWTQ